jgi:hypothetical protein
MGIRAHPIGASHVFRLQQILATGLGTGRSPGLARDHVLRQSGDGTRGFFAHSGHPASLAARPLRSPRRCDADAGGHLDAAGSDADARRHADAARRHADAARDADAGWDAHAVAHADAGWDAHAVADADRDADAGPDAGSDFTRGGDHPREPLVR